MAKSYTFKQVIFALREEYMKIQKQLNDLNQYIEVSDKIENFDIRLVGNPCIMKLYLDKRKNLLSRILKVDRMLKRLGLYTYGNDYYGYDITVDINEVYYDGKKELCKVWNSDEFKNKISKIMKTDFAQNIVANNYVSICCNENQINSLLIDSCGINLLNGINGGYPDFMYDACKDEFIMRNEEKVIVPDDIYKILDLSLDGNYLNDYHHNILNNYKEKEVIIDDNFDSKNARLNIIDRPKEIILKPKKM